MAKPKSRFVCQACGTPHARWAGKCEGCGAWNTLVEEQERPAPAVAAGRRAHRGRALALADLATDSPEPPRIPTGLGEFDRVLGGGLVPGSAVLIGGDPGIGKSTLLLQAVCRVSARTASVYVSGEEAVEQIRLRARRLGLGAAPVGLAASTDIADIVATIDRPDGPRLVVIDSIQTMYVAALDSAPGTVAQVRAAAAELIRAAKRRGCCLLIVGHVTKDGAIAGPRVLEHMVDCVLYFEGDRSHQFRILRGIKNRFGPTDEIGVFEMAADGLREVANPSALFLADRLDTETGAPPSGSAVFAGVEGTRPVLVEIQALVAPSPLGTPRRAVIGWDSGRLAMVLAVLEARCGLSIGVNDIYLNVAGGLRITEPAADLAVAAALVSSLADRPLERGAVVFGEIGLSGEIRAVAQTDARLKEAAKLGFTDAILPDRQPGAAIPGGLRQRRLPRLGDLVALLADTACDP